MKNVKDNFDKKPVKSDNQITNDEILKSLKIKRFLKSKTNDSTKKRYEYHITEFFKFLNKDPENYLIDDYEFLTLEEKKFRKNLNEILRIFKNHLAYNDNKYGINNKPSSIRTILSVIKSLFTYNDIDFSQGFVKRTNNYRNSRTSIAETPTPEQLRKILDNHTVFFCLLYPVFPF